MNNNLYSQVVQILMNLNIPFKNPCQPDYVGDCGVCDTGGTASSITSVVFNNTDGGDSTSITVNWTDGDGNPQSTVSNVVLTLDNQDATQVAFDGSSCGFTSTTVADALCEVLNLSGGDAIQTNTGNIPTTLVNPTTTTPTESETVFQVYDNGIVISVYDGTNWTNIPIIIPTENLPVEVTTIVGFDCTTVPLGQLVTIVGAGTSLDPDWVYRVTDNGAGGCNIVNIESPENHGRVAYVTTTGNDTTGRVGFPHFPFATIQAATTAVYASTLPGFPVVDVIQGDYIQTAIALNSDIRMILREGVTFTGQWLVDGAAHIYSKGLTINTTAHPVRVNYQGADGEVVISGNYKYDTTNDSAVILTNGNVTLRDAVLVHTNGTSPYIASSIAGTHEVLVYNSYSNVLNGDGGQTQFIQPVTEDTKVTL